MAYRAPSCRASACLAWACLVSACLTLVTPAMAQQRPAFPPQRDVTVTYRLRDERGRSAELQVAWSAPLRALRAETRGGDPGAMTGGLPLPPGARLVLDLRGGRAFAAEDRSGLSLDLPRIAEAARRGDAMLAEARFHRLGPARIAGHACTEWRIEPRAGRPSGAQRPILACLTAEGVPLRAQEEGRAARLDALSVAFLPQEAARFAPPQGGGSVEAMGRALGSLLDRNGGAAGAMQSLRGALGGAR